MYKSLDVLNSGGGVVPNSVVYKYSDPTRASEPGEKLPSPAPFASLEKYASYMTGF